MRPSDHDRAFLMMGVSLLKKSKAGAGKETPVEGEAKFERATRDTIDDNKTRMTYAKWCEMREKGELNAGESVPVDEVIDSGNIAIGAPSVSANLGRRRSADQVSVAPPKSLRTSTLRLEQFEA